MHTKDLGIAIRDALDLLGEIEAHDWDNAKAIEETGEVPMLEPEMINDTDVSDASNPIIEMESGARFRLTITRID